MVDIFHLDDDHRLLINHYGFFLQSRRSSAKKKYASGVPKNRWRFISRHDTAEEAIKAWMRL